MSYQERPITKERLEKFISILDSDEGIRIDDELGHVFVNKTAKRYCIEITRAGRDDFVYRNTSAEVMDFLKDILTQSSRIFVY